MTRALLVPQLVRLPGGSFVMGNDAGRPDERPAHEVTVARFAAGVRPVSNAEYREFLVATGETPPPFWDDPRFNHPDQPVVAVSWFEAVRYCEWLSRATGRRFRLPSEAEREYVARGGIAGADWPWGAQPQELRAGLEAIARLEQPHIPTIACANAFGLLCTADNVHEWCTDWYDASGYSSDAAPRMGKRRASRGGSWRHQVKFTRVAARSSLDPSFHYNDYGFRVYSD